MRLKHHKEKKENNLFGLLLIIFYSIMAFFTIVLSPEMLTNNEIVKVSEKIIVIAFMFVILFITLNIYNGVLLYKNNVSYDKIFKITGLNFIFSLFVTASLVFYEFNNKNIWLAVIVGAFDFIKLANELKIIRKNIYLFLEKNPNFLNKK